MPQRDKRSPFALGNDSLMSSIYAWSASSTVFRKQWTSTFEIALAAFRGYI